MLDMSWPIRLEHWFLSVIRYTHRREVTGPYGILPTDIRRKPLVNSPKSNCHFTVYVLMSLLIVVVYFHPNKKRRESREGVVTLKLSWIQTLVKLKHEHPSCDTKTNDTDQKICKVEPRESVKTNTRTRKELPRTTLWTQTTHWLTILIRSRRVWTSDRLMSW